MHEITENNVRRLLGRRTPWLQAGQDRGSDRHYAVCPYCDNPVQLRGLYQRRTDDRRPYGSHSGSPVEGFHFDREDLAFCPYKIKRKLPDRDSRRRLSPVGLQLVETAIAEFDRIVLILRDDFGFSFSDNFAQRMLAQWLDSAGYLYTSANLRNLPWMIAYFAPSQNLFGQPVGMNRDMANSIRSSVPQASVSPTGRLERGAGWYDIALHCLKHRVTIRDDGELEESMLLRVQNYTSVNEPSKAPVIYEKPILFDPKRFEALIHTSTGKARRDQGLLQIARDVAEQSGNG